MKQKEVKRLNRSYNTVFSRLQKNIFNNKDCGLLLFVEYLKYLRDYIILTESCNSSAATLIAAVAEFDAYKQTPDKQQKVFHWNNFCELLKRNMEDWLKIDDSV
jgi:hypothetical protein